MNLSKIRQVKEVYDVAVVNKLLDQGWELLKVSELASTDDRYYTQGIFQNTDLVFVLGTTSKE